LWIFVDPSKSSPDWPVHNGGRPDKIRVKLGLCRRWSINN
jgi:hypothetical protein